MRGTIRNIVIALLLGICTTYASAWLAVLLRDTPSTVRSYSISYLPRDYAKSKSAWEARTGQRVLSEGMIEVQGPFIREFGYDTHIDIGYTNRDIYDIKAEAGSYILAGQLEPPTNLEWFDQSPPDTSPAIQWFITEAGFPFPAVYGTSWRLEDRTQGSKGFISLAAPSQTLYHTPRISRAVPFLPLWRGLLLNMLIHAVAWWLVIGLMPFINHYTRSRRARLSLCTHCSYDRSATPPTAPCPECGHTPPNSTAPADKPSSTQINARSE
jgi:hypothetical protein